MANTIKITFIKSPTGSFNLAYFEGDSVEMPANQAKELMNAGVAKPFDINEDDPIGVDLPMDIPARDLLIKQGIKTMDELLIYPDLTKIAGIGKQINKQIMNYLKK